MIFIYEKVIFQNHLLLNQGLLLGMLTKNKKPENRDEIYMKTVKFANKSSVNNQFPFYSCRAEENNDSSP